MEKLILKQIEGLNVINKRGVNNVKKDLSPKALQIIAHMQHMLDVLIKDRKKKD